MNYRKSEAKEAARAQFRGVWAAIPTPFTPEDRLDEAGLRRNMRRYIEELGVDGVFCAGTMGEFWALTKEERKRVVEIVVEEARGRCGVIAHTGHHSPNETVDLTRHAQQAGADFAIVINPYYPWASEDTLYEWFERVASRVEIGIWMFDTPYSGVALSPQLTARIARIENVCGIKCSRPLDHYEQARRLCGDLIVFSHPSETEFLKLVREHGMRVHMSSAAPYLLQVPGHTPLRDYAELALSGRHGEAARVREAMQPARDVHEEWMRRPWLERKIIPVHYLKAWSELLGMAGGPVRPPLPQVTDAERAALRSDLERCGLLARLSTAARAA
ncbi:MAG TPA: dihydrodipicolinate synthase family protein [Burkholderiales bacterium]|nr:dihydrodipicolinate synthase family protein [Burkholderiales bacterium]